jgi:hypothetical protein
MRKSFQMATVFTGAAACAAVFAPTAGAVTARTAPAVRAGAATARTTAAVPATASENCNAGTKTWVHVYFPAGAHHGPVCFGGRGVAGVADVTRLGVCGGNNSGYISGLSTDHGGHWPIHFGPGTTERNFSKWGVGGDLRVSFVYISGFKGGDTCPQ